MKKSKISICLLPLVSLMALSSCGGQIIDPTIIAFKKENLVQSSFGGLGVEWGVYEDTDKLDERSRERIFENIQRLNPSRIRCMINYDWFVTNFNDRGDEDKTNDTWDYDFTNKMAANLDEILSYCQSHKIEVAFGSWNVVGSLVDDKWNMMDDCTSDIRWAKISTFILDYLVNKKGYTCIRWFVNGNEPNYLGIKGLSKNWNNSFAKWAQGVENVRKAFDDAGLNNIQIVGGDTTGLVGTKEYWTSIAKQCAESVGDYGAHLYLSNYYIDEGVLLEEIQNLNKDIHSIDRGYGSERPVNIWECGLLDGKDAETDSNLLIKTVTYGIRMADFTLQSVLGGVNGLTYWSFDDAMNFIYTTNPATPKRWGMFSSLTSDQPYDQEVRPWFHSSCLLTNLLSPQSKVYASDIQDEEVKTFFRSIGVINEANNSGGFVAINRGSDDITKSYYLEQEINGSGKLYIYTFGEGQIRLNDQGFVKPNYVIDGSLNKKTEIKIPANSMVIVSSEEL